MLGRGGMGIVWLARDETLAENVALKFLPDAVRWDPGAFDDLKSETRRARQLTHPNIIRVHDFVEDAGGAGIAMEWVEGRTLTAERLERPDKVLSPAEILAWLPQLCAALDYAHQQAKVVHRDLKPTNVMLTHDGVVKVGDFGIARSLADSITRVSMMSAGTLVYMSPQQAMGEEPAPADDIYALGATLYELLAGKPPFHTGDVRVQLFQRKPEPIAARRRAAGVSEPKIPRAWEETIAACLAKEPDARPASAGEVAVCLCRSCGDGRERVGGFGGRMLRALPLVATGWRRYRARALAAMVVLAVAGFGAWRLWLRPPATVPTTWPSDATRALAAWNLDGDARDASGRGLHGSVSGTMPTRDRHGRIDRALHFNGNAGIILPDVPALRWSGAQPFTASIWMRPTRPELDVDLWRSMPDVVNATIWSLGLWRGMPQASLSRLQNDTLATATSNTPLAAGEWHHLAVTSDGRELALYANGVLQARVPLQANREASLPAHVDLRIGKPLRLATAAFFGDLDEARLWRRALKATELAALAGREPAPRFAISRGAYSDKDDFAAVVPAEFGQGARLADWDELRRWHRDDTRGWVEEMGLDVGGTIAWVQRGGAPRFEPQRHYFVTRFDGVKPDYFASHDEMGGMTLTLGSWFGQGSPALAVRPWLAPAMEKLSVGSDGVVRRPWSANRPTSALQATWHMVLEPGDREGASVALRMRTQRSFRATCRAQEATFALALGDEVQPQRMRQVPASYGEAELTLVARDGSLRFRAVSAVGAAPMFDETVTVAEFALRDLAILEISCGPWKVPKSNLAPATLIIE